MAERRMFAKSIIDSDLFLDMPPSAQCLYFHLSMRADDEGFVNSPRKIQRMIGASEDDCRLLVAKRFLIPFDTGVVVIRHWRIHNYIQKDRYKETMYREERSMLSQDQNGAYNLMDTTCIQNVSNLETQDRLGKDSIGKISLGKEIDNSTAENPAERLSYDYDFFRETYNSLCRKLPSCRTMPQKRKKAVQNFLKDFTQEQWEEICKAANESEFLTGGNDRGWKANIDFLLRTDKAVKALEGAYTRASYRDKYETDIPENQNPDSIFYGLPDDYFEGDKK